MLIFFWSGAPAVVVPPTPDTIGDGPGVWRSGITYYQRTKEELFDLIREFRRADAKKRRKIVRKAVAVAIEEDLLPPEMRAFARVPLPEVTETKQIDVAALAKDIEAVRALATALRSIADEDDDEEALWALMN